MKSKFSKITGLTATLAMSVGLLAGCGQKEVSSLTVKNGTLDYSYVKGDPYSFDDLKVIVSYNDGTREEVGKDALTIGAFSTDTVGNHKVKISYGGQEITVTLRVGNNESEIYEISGFELPQSIVRHNTLKNYDGDTSKPETLESVFMDQTRNYYVGDDNPFKFLPDITVLDDSDTLVPITSYTSVSKVYVYNIMTSSYDLLEGTNLTDMVAVNELESTYDFTESAIGKKFKLEVRAASLTEEQLLDSDYTKSFEFEVVDGYNVTEAKELGVMNNYNDYPHRGDYQGAWDSFLATDNITVPENLNGIVLHNDITITRDDIPTLFFEGNYLKDYVDLYTIRMDEMVTTAENPFVFYGNYFTVDASAIPHVDITTADASMSHSSLIKVMVTDLNNGGDAHFIMRDASFIGNANRENSESGFGGLLFNKAHSTDYTIENSIIKTYFINSYAEYQFAHLTLNKVKSYDAYQGLVMTHGAEYIDIIDSELKRSGGPATLYQHRDPEHQQTKEIPVVNITNTEIDNKLVGDEAWFAKLGLTPTATLIKGLSHFVSTQSNGTASFVQTVSGKEMIEIIAVYMSDGYGVSNVDCQGKLTLDGDVLVDTLYTSILPTLDGTNPNPYFDMDAATVYTMKSFGAPVLQSSNGGIALLVPDDLTGEVDENTQFTVMYHNGGQNQNPLLNLSLASADHDVFKGEYLTMHYMGLSIVLRYYH